MLGLYGRSEGGGPLPGGGGGAERSDCDGGGPDRNCEEGGLLAEPFTLSRAWPSAPNWPESVEVGGGGVPAAGPCGGICEDGRGLDRMSSMLACSGRRDSGPAATAPGWLSFSLSLSKTCVASSSSSQSMFSFAPLGDVGFASGMAAAVAGMEPVDGLLEIAAGPGRVLAGGGTWLWTFDGGACDGDATAGMFVWLGELLVGPCTA